ncbi:ABC transporter ATP-binding protein [Bacillus altitudinis]|uniref:ABC transporter ATP-binding protein n=1 Tax=Bacillus pumilus TaxID=1408 RepID=UPI00259FF004|nr:ABC transporter ATP-binding protein [Bacillus pumilus]MDM5321919.1 ABC transporter ATP-binding protein [Bacillus pumilus]MDR4994632.1 ABC transporter ATP-binding protein [Bacillus altitudinis]
MDIREVSFSYDQQKDIVQSVTTKIEQGKITTIIGPNGSGKSTLLSLMAHNYAPNKGQIHIDGQALNAFKPKELAKKLAVVHQQNEAPLDLTIERVVAFGRTPYQAMRGGDKEEDERAIEWALSSTKLTEKRKVPLASLSGGERQRVWIAMALAQKTPILFLDEPTTYLDIYYQFDILELIRELNVVHGLTIVMVLHDMNQAVRYSDVIIAMKNGRIMSEGQPNDVLTEENVRHIYDVSVAIKQDAETGMYIVPVGI